MFIWWRYFGSLLSSEQMLDSALYNNIKNYVKNLKYSNEISSFVLKITSSTNRQKIT
jgi:hypothetical protein